ncbi:MAG: hypothetical protein KAJ72_00945 [Candidatus Heimdallarchaeota archaeon]|jgi:hypothetical protein|nr:hypothetical protein [Candidatus Heimdallarchaeota archaeon]
MTGELYKIKFIFPNKGESEGELIRVKGPHLTEIFNRNLPLNSRALKRENLLFIPVTFYYAAEKPGISGKKGDIIFDPHSKAVVILLADTKFDLKVANIGSITKNMKLIEKIESSSGVRIESIQK